MMKALVMHGPGDARIDKVVEPSLKEEEVLLRVRRVGMCGSDLNTFRGKNPLVTYPRVLGHEVAATIEDPGKSGLNKGTPVTFSPYTSCGVCSSCRQGRHNACVNNQTMGVQRDGAMTEYVAVPAAKLYLAQLDLPELCLVEPLTVGAHAAARGRVGREDVVAVFGCGGVGLGAIAASAFRGAAVIAIDVDEAKLETARQAGAKHLVHSGRDDLHERLMEWTDGRGPEVVIEAIGLPHTFRAAVEEVAFAGRVVYIGYAKEPVCYETRLFVQKELDIIGSRNALPEDFREVIRMLEGGNFPVSQTITATVPLEGAPEMLQRWSESPSLFTKIVVNLDE